jgi:hypothetical protein
VSTYLNPDYAPKHTPEPYACALIHICQTPSGGTRITVLYEPARDSDPSHVANDVEALADRLMRVALENGAKEA